MIENVLIYNKFFLCGLQYFFWPELYEVDFTFGMTNIHEQQIINIIQKGTVKMSCRNMLFK